MKKILFCMLITLFLAACGKKGQLVPPEALAPFPVGDLSVRQSGDRFTVCLTPPTKDDAGRVIKDLAGFRVMKREVLPPDEDCEECPAAYRMLQTVDLEYPKEVLRFGNLYCLYDGDLAVGKAYQYKAVSFLADGTTSRDSNKARRRFVSPPAAPALRATSTLTGVILEWTSPAAPRSGALAGFNIYRSEPSARMPLGPINDKPVQGNRYEDKSLGFGLKYDYVVRALAKVDGELVESESSDRVAGELKLDDE